MSKIECDLEELRLTTHTSMTILYGIACLPATFCGILVILIGRRLMQQKCEPLHVFIISMALGDLIETALIYPFEIVKRLAFSQNLELPELTGRICEDSMQILSAVGIYVSCLSLALLNLSKFFRNSFPMKYLLVDDKKAKIICYIIWAFSICFATFLHYAPADFITSAFEQQSLWIICGIAVYSSLIISIHTHFVLKRQRKEHATNKRSLDWFFYIFVTASWTAFTLFCFAFLVFIEPAFNYKTMDCRLKKILAWAVCFFTVVFSANPIGNPFITIFVFSPYRKIIFGKRIRQEERICEKEKRADVPLIHREQRSGSDRQASNV